MSRPLCPQDGIGVKFNYSITHITGSKRQHDVLLQSPTPPELEQVRKVIWSFLGIPDEDAATPTMPLREGGATTPAVGPGGSERKQKQNLAAPVGGAAAPANGVVAAVAAGGGGGVDVNPPVMATAIAAVPESAESRQAKRDKRRKIAAKVAAEAAAAHYGGGGGGGGGRSNSRPEGGHDRANVGGRDGTGWWQISNGQATDESTQPGCVYRRGTHTAGRDRTAQSA